MTFELRREEERTEGLKKRGTTVQYVRQETREQEQERRYYLDKT